MSPRKVVALTDPGVKLKKQSILVFLVPLPLP
jgi:hypothetical protein